MAEQKTKPTEKSVEEFLDSVPGEQVRDDCYTLIRMMKKIAKGDAKMWGPSIVGFGKYHYKYESGHEGFACLAGFSPRKGNITVYVMGLAQYPELLKKLGKYKATKGCLYIKKLDDVDKKVLETLIEKSVSYLKKLYPQK